MGERAALPHAAGPFDIDARYGVVVGLQETLGHPAGVGGGACSAVHRRPPPAPGAQPSEAPVGDGTRSAWRRRRAARWVRCRLTAT